MQSTRVNPWTWQDEFAFSQAWRLEGASAIVLLAGQTGVDEAGNVVHDDFDAECRLLFSNLERVIGEAGGGLKDIYRMTVYLTDIGNLEAFTRIKKEFFADSWPAQTAVGISALAVPGLRVEVEATAVMALGG
jgi:enamine deaminase RidA (YjgF/YER057c/UK114 family)